MIGSVDTNACIPNTHTHTALSTRLTISHGAAARKRGLSRLAGNTW